MADLKAPVLDIIAKIEADTSIKFARIWNNQFKYMEDQQIESFPFPCCFLEEIMPNNYDQLGLGMTISDVIFRFHIGAVEMDSGTGTIEQNTSIFDLRDEIIRTFTYYRAPACSGLQKVSETQDYTHTNVYHYIIDFKCSFVDNVGDQRQGQITTGPPTELEIDVTIVDEII